MYRSSQKDVLRFKFSERSIGKKESVGENSRMKTINALSERRGGLKVYFMIVVVAGTEPQKETGWWIGYIGDTGSKPAVPRGSFDLSRRPKSSRTPPAIKSPDAFE